MTDDAPIQPEEAVDPAVLANRERSRDSMRRMRARRKALREAREAAERPKAPSQAKSSTQRARESRQRARERQDIVRAFLTDVLKKAEQAMESGYAAASHASQAVTARELLGQLDAVQSVALEDVLAIAFFVEDVQDDPEGREEVIREVETAFESRQRQERRKTPGHKAGEPTDAVLDQYLANLVWSYDRLKTPVGAAASEINAGLAACKRLITHRVAPARQADLREFAIIHQTLALHDWFGVLPDMDTPEELQ
jgi:hypothetical protein